MKRHVMVPLDGSKFAEAALPTALVMTPEPGDVLELVLVQEVGPAFALEAWEGAYPEAARSYLSEVAGRLDAGERNVITTVLVGRPATELDARAREAGADLVVMATHGRGALSRFWLGSVADELIRHAHTPVLLIRPGDEASEGATVALNRGRVLVPLDGSERAEAALDAVKALPRATEAHYVLLRIVRYPDELVSAYMPGTIQMSQQVVDEGLREGKAYMDRLSARLRSDGLEVETRVSVESRPASAILSFAEENGIDLIAMATHGRGGVPRAVMGSVTDKIVRGAHVPVLVVRPD